MDVGKAYMPPLAALQQLGMETMRHVNMSSILQIFLQLLHISRRKCVTAMITRGRGMPFSPRVP